MVPHRLAGSDAGSAISLSPRLLPGAAAGGVPAAAGEGDSDPAARTTAGLAESYRRTDCGGALLLRRQLAGGEPCVRQRLCDDILPRFRPHQPWPLGAADADARA